MEVKKFLSKVFKLKKNEIITIFVLFGILIFIGRPFILRSFISMYPTTQYSDVLWLNKLAYLFASPQRGDIILSIDRTNEHRDMPEDRFIRLIHPIYWSKTHNFFAFAPLKPTNVKRIIGLPGETIKIIDKQVYINGSQYNYGTEHFTDVDRIFPLGWFEDMGEDFIKENNLEQFKMFYHCNYSISKCPPFNEMQVRILISFIPSKKPLTIFVAIKILARYNIK